MHWWCASTHRSKKTLLINVAALFPWVLDLLSHSKPCKKMDGRIVFLFFCFSSVWHFIDYVDRMKLSLHCRTPAAAAVDLNWDLIQFANPFWNRSGSEPRNRNNLIVEDVDGASCFRVLFVVNCVKETQRNWSDSCKKVAWKECLQITLALISALSFLTGLSSTGPLEWTGPPPEAWCSLWPAQEWPRPHPLRS